MRTLKIMEHISLDGVIQHSADENAFPYGDHRAENLRSTTRRPASGGGLFNLANME